MIAFTTLSAPLSILVPALLAAAPADVSPLSQAGTEPGREAVQVCANPAQVCASDARTAPKPASGAKQEDSDGARGETAAPPAGTAPDLSPPLAEPEVVEAMPEAAPDAAQRSLEAEAARIEGWLASLDTLTARFTQVGPDGETLSGDFYLSRPGRARFEYDAPAPILVVADGSTVAIRDLELETVDRAPIGQTPLRWLLERDPDLLGSGAMTEAGRLDGALYATFRDPQAEFDGSLTLMFDDPDPEATEPGAMRLEQWFAVDAMGGVTQVSLSETERGGRLDPRLFVLDDADAGGSRRRGR